MSLSKELCFDSVMATTLSLSNELCFDSVMATMLVETLPGKGHFLIKVGLL